MMLWTPTDWAEETRLRIEYIAWLIDHNELPCLIQGFRRMGMLNVEMIPPSDPAEIMKYFSQTGILFVSSEDSQPTIEYHTPTFEEWRTGTGRSVISVTAKNKEWHEKLYKHQ